VARKTQVVLVDDLTGDVLQDGEGQTVYFALDGTSYEIDLSKQRAVAFRAALQRYIDVGRRVGRPTVGRSRSGTARARRHPQDNAAIRAWARENGHQLSERGRIPAGVLAAYQVAH
jgi:hypothetical protein